MVFTAALTTNDLLSLKTNVLANKKLLPFPLYYINTARYGVTIFKSERTALRRGETNIITMQSLDLVLFFREWAYFL